MTDKNNFVSIKKLTHIDPAAALSDRVEGKKKQNRQETKKRKPKNNEPDISVLEEELQDEANSNGHLDFHA